MKSQQKKMPAKKQKQPNQTADDITITLPGYSDTSIIGGFNGISSIDMSSATIPSYTIGSSGSTSYTWSQDYSLNTIANSTVNITGDGIAMEPNADIKIGDRSLKEFMNTVEEHLAILKPAPELEEKWDQLKDLRQQYEALKADILEKEKLMDILKKD
jgi:hypothetical protein